MIDIAGPYVNHVGSCVDSAHNLYAVITQDGAGGADTDVIIKRCAATANPTLAASWEEVARWTEKAFGKHGYGSAEVRADGAFVAMLPERNAANAIVPRVHVIENFCPPWPMVLSEQQVRDILYLRTKDPTSGTYQNIVAIVESVLANHGLLA